MFFIIVFIHIFRGLYYGSYKFPREILWMLGVVILLLMMATAFMGYVLPWGQMSFWGATVITNLFSAFPIVGDYIVTFLWGGFSVDNPTLSRFFVLHYLLPFAIVAPTNSVICVYSSHFPILSVDCGVSYLFPLDSSILIRRLLSKNAQRSESMALKSGLLICSVFLVRQRHVALTKA